MLVACMFAFILTYTLKSELLLTKIMNKIMTKTKIRKLALVPDLTNISRDPLVPDLT